MKLVRLIYTFFVIAVLLGACKVGQKYQAPVIKMPEIYKFGLTDTINVSNLKWFEVYKDTTLVRYINAALENNKDLKIAVARVEEYKALKRIAESDLYPSVNVRASGEGEFENNEPAVGDFVVRGELSWELDIWGKLRWQREAGIADYRATEEERNGVYQSLIAKVAITYFELMAAKRELEIITQTGDARREGLRIADLRFKGGLTAETQYRQAEVELAKTITLIPEVEYTINEKTNQLATLMGEFPSLQGYETRAVEHRLPDSIPVGLPSDLLRRRPDIRKAEQELIAANAMVGVAFTSMFPSITLTAQYGLESGELSKLIQSPVAFVAGQLLEPVFNRGAYKARHQAAKAVLEQKAFSYDQVVLKSFEETSNGLAAVKRSKEVRSAQYQLEMASRNYLKLARLQYLNGVVSYLDVLDAQRQLFEAEIKLNNSIRDLKIAYVDLYKALGGGW